MLLTAVATDRRRPHIAVCHFTTTMTRDVCSNALNPVRLWLRANWGNSINCCTNHLQFVGAMSLGFKRSHCMVAKVPGQVCARKTFRAGGARETVKQSHKC